MALSTEAKYLLIAFALLSYGACVFLLLVTDGGQSFLALASVWRGGLWLLGAFVATLTFLSRLLRKHNWGIHMIASTWIWSQAIVYSPIPTMMGMNGRVHHALDVFSGAMTMLAVPLLALVGVRVYKQQIERELYLRIINHSVRNFDWERCTQARDDLAECLGFERSFK